jgi:hypothetical protein
VGLSCWWWFGAKLVGFWCEVGRMSAGDGGVQGVNTPKISGVPRGAPLSQGMNL